MPAEDKNESVVQRNNNNESTTSHRVNSHGQPNMSRHCSRPKPPLPPMKKIEKGPLCRSLRVQKIREEKVNNKVYETSIQ